MVFKTTLTREYVPKVLGNDESDMPFVVKHYAPSTKLKDELLPSPAVEVFNIGENDERETKVTIKPDVKKLVTKMITGIDNLSAEITIGEKTTTKTFTTGESLFSDDAPPEFNDLIQDLSKYFQELLNKVYDPKN